ncbi:hypothetical protein [Marivita hallyeonensis]|uniref:Hydrogenase expression/formation protein HupK n=1 Tax=Marivita hallyeonensis TaxID=996342 RepID=A0A1M5MLU1_9RHOB|nr:hypothetical protein [Marivita hallyeonensis]SHG77879.1 hypothetical protein SAMN05443551_0555 [Marivita hallyeonensis]
MLDGRAHTLVAETAPPLPVEALVLGKSRREVADLMPRLFNLCRAAQGMATRLALGLPTLDDSEALRREILRDHVLRLTLILPGHFGQSPVPLPDGWQEGGDELARALFGPQGRLPDTAQDFESFCASDAGIAGLLGKVQNLFRDGEAVACDLPFVTATTAGDRFARVENSCAVRVHEHPILALVEHQHGRGPLWRIMARAYDLQALLQGAPLLARSPEPGLAHVPATRGLYTVQANTTGETVAEFNRVTPTDHLQAKGGVLDQTLAALPADRAGLAPLVIDILDPCSPIRVKEMSHA